MLLLLLLLLLLPLSVSRRPCCPWRKHPWKFRYLRQHFDQNHSPELPEPRHVESAAQQFEQRPTVRQAPHRALQTLFEKVGGTRWHCLQSSECAQCLLETVHWKDVLAAAAATSRRRRDRDRDQCEPQANGTAGEYLRVGSGRKPVALPVVQCRTVGSSGQGHCFRNEHVF